MFAVMWLLLATAARALSRQGKGESTDQRLLQCLATTGYILAQDWARDCSNVPCLHSAQQAASAW